MRGAFERYKYDFWELAKILYTGYSHWNGQVGPTPLKFKNKNLHDLFVKILF